MRVRQTNTEPVFREVTCPTCHRPVQMIDDGFTRRIIGHWPRELTASETDRILDGDTSFKLCAGDGK